MFPGSNMQNMMQQQQQNRNQMMQQQQNMMANMVNQQNQMMNNMMGNVGGNGFGGNMQVNFGGQPQQQMNPFGQQMTISQTTTVQKNPIFTMQFQSTNDLLGALQQAKNDGERVLMLTIATMTLKFESREIAQILGMFEVDFTRLNALDMFTNSIMDIKNGEDILKNFSGSTRPLAKERLISMFPGQNVCQEQQERIETINIEETVTYGQGGQVNVNVNVTSTQQGGSNQQFNQQGGSNQQFNQQGGSNQQFNQQGGNQQQQFNNNQQFTQQGGNQQFQQGGNQQFTQQGGSNQQFTQQGGNQQQFNQQGNQQ